ncbi:MAG: thiamine pyrophosphate-dependent dehydrogenase E1 component subunit alpha [Planctomycetota bacterium]
MTPTTRDSRLELYRAMLRIRIAEERIGELYPAKEIRCPVHLHIGQEAVPAGIATVIDAKAGDKVFASHRSHGPYLALNGDLEAFFGELYGKATGCCQGRGGSMHLIDRNVGFFGSSAIVAGTIPIAVGAAFAARVRREPSLAVCFFGDGATEEGVCYESLNFAALHKLAVLFVCENNLYATCSPLAKRQALDNIPERARAFGVTAARIDGNDVFAVADAARSAAARARAGAGPTLIECRTYRWKGHVGHESDTHLGYRSAAELALWMDRCPVRGFEARVLRDGSFTNQALLDVRSQISAAVDRAVDLARGAPFPDAGAFLAEASR